MSNHDESQLARTIGKTIARYRLQAGLTQEYVAEQLEIGGEAVSRMERGLVIPTVARLVELAAIFQCQASDLLTQSSNRSSDQAHYLDGLLSPLGNEDRMLLIEMVEKLAARLTKEARSRTKSPIKPRS